ncbi:tetratricopeptide repeat protein [Xanthobacter sp. 126]|uniref:tetratricopeptide repeat protein n=1 Tax=Xanthobacter sp. 126 TaxID=1131814 RepID=UPI0018CC1755|nr:tetratricopeptide repeat protein [Xanthobacter sp. 126]
MNERISYSALKGMSADELRAQLSAEPARSAALVRAAAHNGILSAQVVYGQMLLDGTGVPRDPQAAYRWFVIAADAGSLDGVNMVGRCHELGWGVPRDLEEAGRRYRAAAVEGHVWAQFNLGTLLVNAAEFTGDPALALHWFVRAARRGHPKAMAMVGRFLEQGWGRPVDPAAARRWYRRAALGGDYRGQFDYARTRYADGAAEEAIAWFARSMETAVPDFCRLAAEGLRASGDPALVAIADRALERVRHAETEEAEAAQAEAAQREAAVRKARPRRGFGRWLRRR